MHEIDRANAEAADMVTEATAQGAEAPGFAEDAPSVEVGEGIPRPLTPEQLALQHAGKRFLELEEKQEEIEQLKMRVADLESRQPAQCQKTLRLALSKTVPLLRSLCDQTGFRRPDRQDGETGFKVFVFESHVTFLTGPVVDAIARLADGQVVSEAELETLGLVPPSGLESGATG